MISRAHTSFLLLITASTFALLTGCAQLSLGRRAPAAPEAPSEDPPEREQWQAPVAAAAPRSDEDGLARLTRFADVWQTARWFHPGVVGNEGAWDTTFLRHVDAVRSSTDAPAEARAVQSLLGELLDAETRVTGDTTRARSDGAQAAVLRVTADSLLVVRPVHLNISSSNLDALRAQLGQTIVSTSPRAAAVFDLRADSGGVSGGRWYTRSLTDDEIPLPGGTLTSPARRRLRHDGAPLAASDAHAQTARYCCTSYTLSSGATLRAQPTTANEADPGRALSTVVVIVNDATIIPAPLYTLHAAGQVRFVSTGTGVLHSDAQALHLPLGGGFHARVRVEELLLANGMSVPTRADTVVTQAAAENSLVVDTTDHAITLALSIARGRVTLAARQSGTLAPPSQSASLYNANDAIYPSLPERLLAVTKLWSTVRAFNPYLPMADESWDDMFERALGDVEVAATAREYVHALMRFSASLDASQASISVPDHPEFGTRIGYVPFSIRLVDRRAIVIGVDDSAVGSAGASVGDEVIAVGGEPIDKRLARWRELMSASNEWSRDQRLVAWLEAGPLGAAATYRIRSAGGTVAEREFAYANTNADAKVSPEDRQASSPRRSVELLSGGVVRVRLGDTDSTSNDVALPAEVAAANAIVIDARGIRDDKSLRWLARSVLDADARAYARDERQQLTAPSRGALRNPELDPARHFSRAERRTPQTPGDAFTGPMAILVDATTIGDGELLALRLLAGGSNRVLVGTQTAGAVGNVATVLLPGRVSVNFPVSDVRHTDGRFIQRLGLTPNIHVAPTVAGVRSGRDEVMEAAQRWIAQQLAPAPARRR